MKDDISFLIAQYLAKIWNDINNDNFIDYLLINFGYHNINLPKFSSVYIAEAENGDAKLGVIGSLIKHWWIFNQKEIQEIKIHNISFDINGEFYITPILTFYHDKKWITIGERIGPNLRCRKIAQIFPQTPNIIQEIKLFWYFQKGKLIYA